MFFLNYQAAGWSVILHLAFQSIGIVYGDIGTSPLYVYASTFTDGIKHNDDILGVLSLIFYTLTLIPLVKYVFIVLQANDNGEGNSFEPFCFSLSLSHIYKDIYICLYDGILNLVTCCIGYEHIYHTKSFFSLLFFLLIFFRKTQPLA